MTTTTDLPIQQGVTWRQDFQWLHDDGTTPVNITGITLRSKAKPYRGAGLNLWNLTSTSGITVLSTSQGLFRIEILASVTDDYPPGTYVYDIEADEGSGYVSRLFAGTLVVDREVTT